MKKELLKRTIQNLKDEYTRNHEVMEEAENEQLLNDIAELEKLLATMNQHYYKHPSGLVFEVGRLMDENEEKTYDITIVCLWLTEISDVPMIIAGWYYGRSDDRTTAEYADKWMADKTPEEINELLRLQTYTEE